MYTLDDRPALDAYLKRLASRASRTWIRRGWRGWRSPTRSGSAARNGEEQVRFISGGDFAERSLSCIAEVPQGALVWVMEGDAQSVLEATDAACGDSLAALGGRLRWA